MGYKVKDRKEYRRLHHLRNREYDNMRNAEHYAKWKEYYRWYRSVELQLWRMQALEAYGLKCAWCGQSNPLFLTFDNINNNRKEDKRCKGNVYRYDQYLVEQKPIDIQILCHNCNMAKQHYKLTKEEVCAND